MTPDHAIRAGVSVLILVLFGTAYLQHPDNALLVGALISMATLAAQYWLGSTAGAAKTTDNTGKALDAIRAAQNTPQAQEEPK
jgi:inner membrane protein involved in colicin E2 resistance